MLGSEISPKADDDSRVQYDGSTPSLCSQAKRTVVYRAFHCLRMSNFLLRPTLYVVQTYLLIVIVLQNDSEADAAWALLGTVMRLAQSIGLHLRQSSPNDIPSLKVLKDSTWYIPLRSWVYNADIYRQALVWQDCLLSLCYGRPATMTEVPPRLPDKINLADDNQRTSYRDCLWRLSNLTLLHLGNRSTNFESREQVPTCIQQIEAIQSLVGAPAAAARQTSRDRLEYHSFKLYSSFVISFLCQQRLRHLQAEQVQSKEQSQYSEKLVRSLADSITSFLALQTTSMFQYVFGP